MPHMSSNPFAIDTLITVAVFVMFVIFLGICIYAAGLLWDDKDDDEQY